MKVPLHERFSLDQKGSQKIIQEVSINGERVRKCLGIQNSKAVDNYWLSNLIHGWLGTIHIPIEAYLTDLKYKWSQFLYGQTHDLSFNIWPRSLQLEQLTTSNWRKVIERFGIARVYAYRQRSWHRAGKNIHPMMSTARVLVRLLFRHIASI